MDQNLDTLEEEFVARLKSDTSQVTVSGTTSETALMSNTVVPAASLQAGSVLQPWSYGTITIPASSTPSVIWRLRWGGTGGTVLTTWTWNFNSNPSSYTLGWIAYGVLVVESTGTFGSMEVDTWMTTGNSFSTGLTTLSSSVDTTSDQTLLWTADPSLSTVSVTQRTMVTNRG